MRHERIKRWNFHLASQKQTCDFISFPLVSVENSAAKRQEFVSEDPSMQDWTCSIFNREQLSFGNIISRVSHAEWSQENVRKRCSDFASKLDPKRSAGNYRVCTYSAIFYCS